MKETDIKLFTVRNYLFCAPAESIMDSDVSCSSKLIDDRAKQKS